MKVVIAALIVIVVLAALVALPAISIDVDAVITSSAYQYIRAAMYFIPVGTASAICSIILGLWVFRIIIAFVKVLWDVLPFASK